MFVSRSCKMEASNAGMHWEVVYYIDYHAENVIGTDVRVLKSETALVVT